MNKFIKKFSDISINDIESVGGKNASLGEMINNLSSLGVNVPDGFATTSYAFQEFLKANRLDKKIPELLKKLDVNSIKELKKTGSKIRNLILKAKIPYLQFDRPQLLKIYLMPLSLVNKKPI